MLPALFCVVSSGRTLIADKRPEHPGVMSHSTTSFFLTFIYFRTDVASVVVEVLAQLLAGLEGAVICAFSSTYVPSLLGTTADELLCAPLIGPICMYVLD